MKKFKLKVGKIYLSSDVVILFILIAAALTLKLSFEKFDLLNERFFFDQETILNYISSTTGFTFGSNSFQNTAFFYKVLGMEHNLPLVIIATFAITIYICFKLLYLDKTLSLFSFIYILSFLLLSSIFLQMYSKDAFVLILLSIPILFRGKIGYFLFFILAFLYATYLRQYWFIILGSSLCLYFYDKHIKQIRGAKTLLALGAFGLVILAFLFEIFLDLGLNAFRDQVNDVRQGSEDAKTIILPYVPLSNPIMEALNTIITWILLMVPAPLFLAGSVRHILSSLLTLFLFYKFWKNSVFFLKRNSKDAIHARYIIFLIFSFTLVQSIFEPDYGSFLRHLTPVFPLFIYFDILCTNERKKV